MPIDYALYPPWWKQFSHWVRHQRAQGRCECTGQCGLHPPNPFPRRCCEQHGHSARWARGTITLTVAHLCACQPLCARQDHVIAACQRCHLRIDATGKAHRRRQHPNPTQNPLVPAYEKGSGNEKRHDMM
jgi:hypothetical protein